MRDQISVTVDKQGVKNNIQDNQVQEVGWYMKVNKHVSHIHELYQKITILNNWAEHNQIQNSGICEQDWYVVTKGDSNSYNIT